MPHTNLKTFDFLVPQTGYLKAGQSHNVKTLWYLMVEARFQLAQGHADTWTTEAPYFFPLIGGRKVE